MALVLAIPVLVAGVAQGTAGRRAYHQLDPVYPFPAYEDIELKAQ
jgi:hypothetical protein